MIGEVYVTAVRAWSIHQDYFKGSGRRAIDDGAHQGDQIMRTFFFALAAIVPAFAIDRAGAADEPPAFDISRNCREEVVGAITSVDACAKDEVNAKNELTKRWSEFGASEKKTCTGEASIGGDKSYVELLTCLEMYAGQLKPKD